MGRYDDINPMDIDPETNEPYRNYSSPALDTSFHDHEMDVDEPDDEIWMRWFGGSWIPAAQGDPGAVRFTRDDQ